MTDITADHIKRYYLSRLSLRVEGNFWNAYAADPNNKKEAIYLGGIRTNLINQEKHLEQLFIDLIQDALAGCLSRSTNSAVEWYTTAASSQPQSDASQNSEEQPQDH